MRLLEEAVRNELALRPACQAQDVLKLMFQALLGVGHLLGEEAQVTRRIADEQRCAAPVSGEQLCEPIGPRYMRLNLRPAMAAALPPVWIARMMAGSAAPKADRAALRAAVSALPPLPGISAGELNSLAEALCRDETLLPGHSEAYRAAYHPAYRLIDRAWLPLLPLLCAVAALPQSAERLLITVDGPCAGGKSTLAARLSALTGADLVHMDDYLIPHRCKTPQRLAIPGGNADIERLEREVLIPWQNGEDVLIRRYNCHADELEPPCPLHGSRLLLVEGCCANLPPLRRAAALRVFVTVPPQLQWQRLQARESPASCRQFRERWLPLEEAYFRAYALPDADCIRVDGAALSFPAAG